MGLSGSTLCYNIFRIINNNSDYNYELIKLHEYNESASDSKNIFVIRDLRDTIASMLRKDPTEWNGDVKRASYNQMNIFYNSWDGKNKDFIWKYEDYKSNPYEYVKKASSILGINITYDLVKKVVNSSEKIKETNIPFHQNVLNNEEESLLWKTTKMSKRHITNDGKIGGYKNYLTEEQIRFIETEYRYFFETHNYQLEY